MARLGPGEVVDGRYEVRGVLGQGGMGVVYRAFDLTRDVEVALKVVRMDVAEPVDVMRFVRESELVAKVDRLGGVARVHAAGRHQGAPYYVMELVAGRDLQALLREGPLDPRRLAAIVERVARTLGACHAAGIVHRDVKPGNVLVADDGAPRLLDFGLAKDVQRQTRMTATGEVAGTPAFMAPEQVEGQTLDGRADVYALGAILYYGLAGRAPFQGSPLAIIEAKVARDPPAPSTIRADVPPDLETICVRAMARVPGDRYPTAEALADDLARWSRGESVGPGRSAPMRRRVALALAAVALTATVAIVAQVAASVTPAPDASPTEVLQAARELDRRALTPYALGLGPGAPPAAAEVRSRLVALRAALPLLSDAERRDAVTRAARLAANERQLSGRRDADPDEGAPGLLVDALRRADAGRVLEAADLVARVAAERAPPPELPLVAHRVALAALERAVEVDDVLALLPAATTMADGRGLALARSRAAALGARSTIEAWATRLQLALADEPSLASALASLRALLALGPAAPADDVRFLAAVWAVLEVGPAKLEQRALIDAAFCAVTAGALPPPASLTRDLLAASSPALIKIAGMPTGRRFEAPTPSIVLAALRHGLHLAPRSLWELDLLAIAAAAPRGSQAAAYVRFVVDHERSGLEGEVDTFGEWRRRLALALEVVDAPVTDLAPALRVEALAAAVTAGARALAHRPSESIHARFLACGAELRSRLDGVDLREGDPTPQTVAKAELRGRCSVAGWGDAPALTEWLAADARRRAVLRPAFRPWLGATLAELADALAEPEPDDAAGRPRRLEVVLRLVEEVRHQPTDESTAWLAAGLRLKALRKLDRLEDAERAFAPQADQRWGWLFAVQAVRLASERGDHAAFVARRAKALGLYPQEPALLAIEAPR